MIRTEILPDGRTHTWSDRQMRIKQDTGIVYDDAIDIVPHTYTETDEPIPSEEATAEDYENSLNRLGL